MKGSTLIDDCSVNKSNECTLSISYVRHPQDSGDYYCVGENKVGEMRLKLDLQITSMKVFNICVLTKSFEKWYLIPLF